jgi:hypothetical protein
MYAYANADKGEIAASGTDAFKERMPSSLPYFERSQRASKLDVDKRKETDVRIQKLGTKGADDGAASSPTLPVHNERERERPTYKPKEIKVKGGAVRVKTKKTVK